MKLTKTVPSRQKTLTAEWCRKDWMTMSPLFRTIRGGTKSPMEKCHWCGHMFVNGEMMALASFTEIKTGNRTLCGTCADELLSSADDDEIAPLTTDEIARLERAQR